MIRTTARLAAAVLTVGAPLARAQTPARDTTSLVPLVVTATRLPTAASALTATVSVLDGDALRAEGVTHLGDALRRVPGLALARTSSFGSQQALFVLRRQTRLARLAAAPDPPAAYAGSIYRL